MPGNVRAREQLRPGLAIVAKGGHPRQRLVDRPRAFEREHVGVRTPPFDVERLGAVRERVHGGADRHFEWELEGQARVVDDAGEVRSRAAALHAALAVTDSEARGPFGACVCRRHRDDRQARCDRDGLGQVDRAAAADCQQPVGVLGSRGDLVDPVAWDLTPAARGRQVELRPALAGDQQWPLDPELAKETRKLAKAPADDHATSLARAKSMNASAARVGDRPAGRTSEISRTGPCPLTRAAASVPASSSASTPDREMKVTPYPAATALFTDSCSPSSSRT